MRNPLTFKALSVVLLTVMLFLVHAARSPLSAAEPSFAGTWAEDLTTCKLPQEDQNAPMILSKSGYDQHEAHCKFKKLEGKGGEWKADADCSVEGDSQSTSFTFSVSGDTLTIGEDGSTRDYLRCK